MSSAINVARACIEEDREYVLVGSCMAFVADRAQQIATRVVK